MQVTNAREQAIDEAERENPEVEREQLQVELPGRNRHNAHLFQLPGIQQINADPQAARQNVINVIAPWMQARPPMPPPPQDRDEAVRINAQIAVQAQGANLQAHAQMRAAYLLQHQQLARQLQQQQQQQRQQQQRQQPQRPPPGYNVRFAQPVIAGAGVGQGNAHDVAQVQQQRHQQQGRQRPQRQRARRY